MNEIQHHQYLEQFPDDQNPDQSKRRAALEEARDNRKFEIEMYWKRAAYFWAFIAAAFAGYFLQKTPDSAATSFVIACLGFVFSLAWYFVNRGSKYWQQNWELHVDLLENDISGPLYKTVVQPSNYRFCRLNGAYPFSVSKINQLLSLFITVVWIILIARAFAMELHLKLPVPHATIIGMTTATVTAALAVLCRGRTGGSDGDVKITKFYRRSRTYN